MIRIRKSADRGPTNLGWLDSRHSFSFGRYHDPAHMGFGPLRVINEDRVAPGGGFGTHHHDNMEIVSYVLDGALEHKDSMGNGEIIRPGDIQRMSAGTGVSHSEFNPSPDKGVHFLQIWFLPAKIGIAPSYAQASIPESEKTGRLKLALSADGRDGSLTIHQDIDMYAALMNGGADVVHRPAPGRLQWVQVAKGAVDVNGHRLEAGDGAGIVDEGAIVFSKGAGAEFLFFDMGR